jgi:hypothetical protein
VSDAGANELAASYVNAMFVVYPRPSLIIAQEGQAIALSWPSWGTNFTLQAAEDSLPSSASWTNLPVTVGASSNGCTLTLPVSGNANFYRLFSP